MMQAIIERCCGLEVHQEPVLACLLANAPRTQPKKKVRRSGRARKGDVHLRAIPVGAAISASKARGNYLKDKYARLKARRGALRAARHRPQDSRRRLSHAR
jgi:hypothetical protein